MFFWWSDGPIASAGRDRVRTLSLPVSFFSCRTDGPHLCIKNVSSLQAGSQVIFFDSVLSQAISCIKFKAIP